MSERGEALVCWGGCGIGPVFLLRTRPGGSPPSASYLLVAASPWWAIRAGLDLTSGPNSDAEFVADVAFAKDDLLAAYQDADVGAGEVVRGLVPGCGHAGAAEPKRRSRPPKRPMIAASSAAVKSGHSVGVNSYSE